jgi:hypothetical protein
MRARPRMVPATPPCPPAIRAALNRRRRGDEWPMTMRSRVNVVLPFSDSSLRYEAGHVDGWPEGTNSRHCVLRAKRSVLKYNDRLVTLG